MGSHRAGECGVRSARKRAGLVQACKLPARLDRLDHVEQDPVGILRNEVTLPEGLVAQLEEDGQPCRAKALVNRVRVLDLEIQQQAAGRAPAKPRRDRLVVQIENRQVHRLVFARLQVDVPVRSEQRPEAQVLAVEVAGSGDVLRHQDRVVARRLHRVSFGPAKYTLCMFRYYNIQVVCQSKRKGTGHRHARRSPAAPSWTPPSSCSVSGAMSVRRPPTSARWPGSLAAPSITILPTSGTCFGPYWSARRRP